MDWLTKTPVAHRGLHDVAKGVPENSLAAFQAAVEAGYPIELDVRLAGDGDVVVMHDSELERLTARFGPVIELGGAELRQLSLLGTDQRIAGFDETLDLIAGRVPLVIELKNFGRDVEPLESAVLGQLRRYDGLVAVQAFNSLVLKWFETHAPDLIRGQITTDLKARKGWFTAEQEAVLREFWETGAGSPHYLAHDVKQLPHRYVDRARADGMPVLGWTVKSEADWKAAAAYVDNIIFEGFRP